MPGRSRWGWVEAGSQQGRYGLQLGRNWVDSRLQPSRSEFEAGSERGQAWSKQGRCGVDAGSKQGRSGSKRCWSGSQQGRSQVDTGRRVVAGWNGVETESMGPKRGRCRFEVGSKHTSMSKRGRGWEHAARGKRRGVGAGHGGVKFRSRPGWRMGTNHGGWGGQGGPAKARSMAEGSAGCEAPPTRG